MPRLVSLPLVARSSLHHSLLLPAGTATATQSAARRDRTPEAYHWAPPGGGGGTEDAAMRWLGVSVRPRVQTGATPSLLAAAPSLLAARSKCRQQ